MKSHTIATLRNAKKIGVFGSDGDHCSEKAKKIAYDIGKLLANKGWIIVTGGGKGVMEEVSKGAFENEGIVIGILPEDKKENGNNYSTFLIPTGIGFARGQIISNFIDGAILIEGGLGTYQEAAYTYWLEKPTVAISSSGGVAREIAGKSLDKRNLKPILEAKSEEEAVQLLNSKL